MNAFSDKLATLKTKIQFGQDFTEIFEWYLENLGEKEAFLKAARPIYDSKNRACQILAKGVELLAGAQVKAENIAVQYVPGENFYLGGTAPSVRVVTFIYFDDIGVGLWALVSLNDPTTHLLRLTCKELGFSNN